MHFLYNIGILTYGLAIKITSLFNSKAKLWIDGRRNFFSNLPDISHQNTYWFHCASLGEFDQALPIINLIKEKDPTVFVLITFFSPSGYLHYHKREHKADYVCYLPLDTPQYAKKFIDHIKPKKVFFVKYEFWANYIFEIKKSGAELYCISAIFRENQVYFKKYDRFFRSILYNFDYFFLQDENSGFLLNKIGLKNYIVTGDTRFDRVIENKNRLKLNSQIERFVNNQRTFIIGSSWSKDEEIVIPSINSSLTDLSKVIIAPHNVSEQNIQKIINQLEVPFIRYTELESNHYSGDKKVLILDTIGHLANAYYYGSYAYVGGGFSGKLHNILEPAVFGLPVIFGPNHDRFPEAKMFIENIIGFSISTKDELISSIENITINMDELKAKTKQFIDSQSGAAIKVVDYLFNPNS